MKKLFLIALLLGMSTTICHSQVKISVQGGTGLTGITKSKNYNADFGYRFGVDFNFPINQTWSIQTGLQLLNRSYSFKDNMSHKVNLSFVTGIKELRYHLFLDSKINALYLQIPIKTAIYFPVSNQCGIRFSIGPYIAYGIGGKINNASRLDTYITHTRALFDNGSLLQTDESSENTFGNDGLKRIDLGINIGSDFRYKQFFFGISAEYGLLPINKECPEDLFNYAFELDQKVISPHNIGVEFHVGFCFSVGKR